MSYMGFQILSLAFHGPERKPAAVAFRGGLNVIYGASDTGKSFIVEAIDFMFGGKGPLKNLPEAKGFDQILMAVKFSDNEVMTIRRGMNGGAFRVYQGHYLEELPDEEGRELAAKHSATNNATLSGFLLEKIGLSEKKIRKNAKDEVRNLSFRNLARLVLVNEEEIIQKRSPLSDGNYTADTANMSVFRMLLTGRDDSALIAMTSKTPEEQKREAQIELLDQLIEDAKKRVESASKSQKELTAQEGRLNAAMNVQSEQLSFTEKHYKELSSERRSLMKRREENKDRFTEVAMLLVRFELLRQHYNSDIERLIGIEEAGNILAAIDADICPVCGSSSEHHKPEIVCQGDVDGVAAAAVSEIRKIERREVELSETIDSLNKEQSRLVEVLPKIDISLREKINELQSVVAPDLRKQRASYKELADKGADVREEMGRFDTLRNLVDRKSALENSNSGAEDKGDTTDLELTDTMVSSFSSFVKETLNSWGFPGDGSVHFDLKAKDLVISGKPRISYGKGLRAITQAAFTISLLEYCVGNDKAHPGFVILDSPLLSYREPDGDEDDLSGTDLNSNFYRYLLGVGDNRQIIIVENTDPPSDVELGQRVEHFSGLESEGRFGLFPNN